ncbi:MAG: hypothetical protein RBU21_18070 [FCB group bacterium]|jgi:hypothetical protein|nr:hypothetical protein [FCB group bacterium]
MFGLFARKQKPEPLPPSQAAQDLVAELNDLDESRPRKGFWEGLSPWGEPEEVDALTEAAVYLAYGRVVQAEQRLREALLDATELRRMKWIPGGEDYARNVLRRIQDLPEFRSEVRA